MSEEAYIFLPSFAQQRLWFIDQLMPGTPAYNLPTAMRLAGALDPAALARGLREVVRRHETTRTTFATVDGALVQVVAPEGIGAPILPLLDLRALPQATREAAARALAADEARRPFDLARGPLLRAGLLRLGPDEHVLLLTMHHIVSDGWSMGVLVRELAALYAAYTGGAPAALPELPIQYADYAHWQREWLGSAGDHAESPMQTQLAYWQRALEGAPAVLELPTDHPRTSLQSFAGARRSLAIARPLVDSLKRLCQQERVTLFMVLLAAFDTLLARYSGQSDILIGTPIANRTQGETEGLIGCFINTLVLRTDLSGDPTFRELARRVRETALGAYAHQDLPFELLVEALAPARELGYNPLFQVMFGLQNMPPIALDVPGLRLRPLEIARDTAMFDLNLALEETGAGLRGTLEYSTELFEHTTVARLLAHFETLLAASAADPDRRIADLPLLTPGERQQIVAEWNATQFDYPHDRCLHHLFEAQAARTPDAIACLMMDGDPAKDERRRAKDESGRGEACLVPGAGGACPAPTQHLTYGELNARANQLAQHLHGLGVGPQVLVALCVERSLDLAVALLGVLKAGGAFLPLDPTLPSERISFMLEDSGAAVLLTASAERENGRAGEGENGIRPFAASPLLPFSRSVVDLRADWPAIASEPAEAPPGGASPADLAYMIYTSGSTGRPKGVPIRHASAVPFFLWYQEYFGLCADDRVIQYHSLSFDFSTWEIFEALIAGAALHVVPDALARDVGALADYLAEARISVLNMTPSQFSGLCDYVEQFRPGALAATRMLVLGGELFPAALARRAARLIPPGCRLYNEYGPTETTISSSIFRVTAAALERHAGLPSVPIGRPIGNTQLYLLDARLRPVPIGLPGDLYIGGAGLAREYFGRPDLTAERFIPNPFAEVSGIGYRVSGAEPSDTRYPAPDTRLYKTGDLARYHADGTIEFLGRLDDQVKLRGFRIELGEIEATLSRHPAVQGCVVLAREDAPGDKRLVAYIVQGSGVRGQASKDSTPDALTPDLRSLIPDLRAFLAERLPDYMRPATFVLLDALPLTPNGKVDRRVLPAPDSARPELAEDFVAPRTPAEETLTQIWAAVLRLERVGVYDNFFMLGGDSILSIQVIARASQAGLRLTPRQVFQHQTIAELAAVALPASGVSFEQGPASGEDTPAGFPLARLNQPALERLVSRSGPIADIYPLAPMQQGLLFHTLSAPESGVYVQQVSCLLEGELNRAAFIRAWQSVVARHPVLRSAVAWEGLAEPLQVVSKQAALPLAEHDWRDLAVAEQQIRLGALLRADRAHGFDLTSAPLMRLTIIQLDPATTYLLWSHHHLLLDGWSVPLVLNEVVMVYLAECAGRPVTLPQPRPYRDYIAWLQRQDLAQAEAFWRARLRGLTAATPLVVDHGAGPAANASGEAAERQAALDQPATDALLALGRERGLTLNTLVQGAWALLLGRYSGASEVVFGATVAGRPPELPGVETMVGLFINTLPLRAPVAGGATTVDWLGQLQDQQLAMRQYEYSPLAQVQSWSDVPRGQPLFESIVVFENYPQLAADASQREQAGLTIRQVRTVPQTNYPLMLVAMPGPALTLRLIYARRRFAPDTVERMLGHLRTLLAGMADQPGARLADLPLLTAAERQQLLVEWNEPGNREQGTGDSLSISDAWCLHELVEAQAARTPDAIAVVFETTNDEGGMGGACPARTQHLTYAELNARANRLAHHLRGLGVGPEVRVGIIAARSPELVIGLLGVLKAGGAYVPIDPAYPAERISFMLEDSGAAVLITASAERENGRAGERENSHLPFSPSPLLPFSASVVDLYADWPIIARQPVTNPHSGAGAGGLAYVIYTSGSTGTPKGVLVSHGNVRRLFAVTQPRFGFGANDVWTLFHSAAFDFSVWELWGALAYGGRLVVVPFATSRAPDSFFGLLRDQGVTVLNQTPTAFRQLTAVALARAERLRLRLVIFGGEALDLAALRPWAARYGLARPRLVNMYGITETTVHVTVRPLRPADLADAAGSLIGGPLPDLRLYLLDPRLRLVPIGVPGELHIGGAGLARGYLGRPDLTAERFIPNPFAPDGSSQYAVGSVPTAADCRLYKTGDLARRLPNGDIEYLGRIDEQVKLRGFRIELGEIEAALAQHPSVRAAVVVARQDEPGERRLVAYIVQGSGVRGQGSGARSQESEDERRTTNDESESSSFVVRPSSFVTELRAFLASRLPDYMIPAAFVFFDALPLTPNGKLDRAALPAPSAQRSSLETPFAVASTPREELLAAIWAHVLGHDQVGIDDHFFALGGDSISSIQVISRAREHGLALTLPQLFQHPTIRALARELATADPEGALAAPAPPFGLIAEETRARLPQGIEDAYPLTMLQAGMLFHSVYTPGSAAYHNINSLHLRAPFDEPALRAALQQLAAHHPVLRTSFDLTSYGEPLQLVQRPVEVPLHVVDLRHLPPEQHEALIAAWFAEEQRRPFDWTRAPLLRFQVHRRSAETFQFSWAEHHAILDGWSVASLLTELFQLYMALCGAGTAPPAPPRSSFRDFVALERATLASDAARQFWAEYLAEAEITPLPRWPADPAENKPALRTRNVPIAPGVSAGLQRLARSAAVPLKSVLLAAHLRALALLSGQRDLLTGLVANGRPEWVDGERVLGLFLNTLPLRQRLLGGTWVELVRAVFANEQALLPHRRYPLAELQRGMGGRPLFETAFNFVHFHVYQRLQAVGGLEVLGRRAVEQTNFTLMADFSRNPLGEQVQLTLSADGRAIGQAQLAMIAGVYARVLGTMAGAPESSYDAPGLLPHAESQRLLVEWNDTAAGYPHDRCIHDLFEAQAARTPDAIAVVFAARDDERRATNDERRTTNDHQLPTADCRLHLTYAELNRRANQLAWHLRTLGVGPEVRVGLCVERSLDMVVGLLGVLRAGGAYVPLDPAYPSERLAFMLDDAAVPVLLTASTERENGRTGERESFELPFFLSPLLLFSRSVVDLRADWPVIARQPAREPLSGVTPANLAYVIYTSGSTGVPKGVPIPHDAVVNFLSAMRRRPGVTAQDRLLAVTTISFDIAALELFLPLTSGACVELASRAAAADGVRLAAQLARSRATLMQATPATWRLLLAAGWPGDRRLRVLCGGEALPPDLAGQLLASSAALWNMYGPTETTIWSAVRRVGAREPTMAIGGPIANTQIYLLDPQFQPVPTGAPGELYIGGAGLARGYLNRPELTAERFIPNPFANERRTTNDERRTTNAGADPSSFVIRPSSRLYRTGDLARYRPDGSIEFLGRIDHQVKIRGFRIELGEIEAALRSHPGVAMALAMAREDVPGQKRLVAYVVPVDEGRTTQDESSDSSFVIRHSSFVAEMRAFLAERLPAYMLPAAFVVLDALPLTANGKLDRRALPAPDRGQPEPGVEFIAPRSDVETRLARIWRQVLGRDQIGVHDDFFALGGDSILSLQIITCAREEGIYLSAQQVFEHRTIAALAALAETDAPAPQGPLGAAVPLTPFQRWFFAQDLPDPQHFSHALLLETIRPLERGLLVQTVRHLLAHHDALRLRFTRGASGWAQTDAAAEDNPVVWWIDLADLAPADHDRAIAAASAAVQASLDLARGPLVRVAHFDLGAGRPGRLLLAAHRLAADGESWRVLLEDLQTAYEQLRHGLSVALPPRTTAFRAWAERLDSYAQTPALRDELAIWIDQPWDNVARLPVDERGGANTAATARTVRVGLDAGATAALLHEVPQTYRAQIDEALAAALAQSLARWTGASTLLIDLEGHGREELFDDIDLSRTVGCFTARFPALLELPGEDDPGAALKAVKEQLRRLPHGGIGYGLLGYLSRDAAAREALERLPQAEISFSYRGPVDQALAEHGLFEAAHEFPGSSTDRQGWRQHLLEIDAAIVSGQLQLAWTYSVAAHRPAMIERLAEDTLAALEALIAGCQSPDAGEFSPSDFPLLDLPQDALDKIFSQARFEET